MANKSKHNISTFCSTLLPLWILTFLITRVAHSYDEQNVKTSINSRTTDMHDVLRSLEKVAEFYYENIEKVNLDSLFGVRVGQGALNKAITESKLNKQNQIFTMLRDIHSKIVEIAERGFIALKLGDSEYFHKFEQLIEGKWFAVMPYHSADKSLLDVTQYDDSVFDEISSDTCMTDLMGSQTTGLQQACKVTEECWNLMTKKGAGGYYLTHQGLFLLLAEMKGCRTVIMKQGSNDEQWQHQIRYLGANIYHQMRTTFEEGKTSDNNIGKDLFAEQLVVCQMLGVVECFNVMFLDSLLRLQDDSGCWKQMSQEDAENEAKESREGIYNEENNAVVKFAERRLQEEIVLKDGCSAHFTGVATGCVGMYAYWFSSHPDTLKIDNEFSKDSGKFSVQDRSDYIQFKPKEKDQLGTVFFLTRWIVVFFLVSALFYYFRKWRRRPWLTLRKLGV